MRRDERSYNCKELNLLADCVYKCWQLSDIDDDEEIELLSFLDNIQKIINNAITEATVTVKI